MSVGYPLADKKAHYGTKAYLKSDSDMLFLFHRKLPSYETGKIMGKEVCYEKKRFFNDQ